MAKNVLVLLWLWILISRQFLLVLVHTVLAFLTTTVDGGWEQVSGAKGNTYRLSPHPQPLGEVTGSVLPFTGFPALPGRWRLPAVGPASHTACPQLSESSLICLPDGQMKAGLFSMQMVVQVALQLKNDKEIFLLGCLETSLPSCE